MVLDVANNERIGWEAINILGISKVSNKIEEIFSLFFDGLSKDSETNIGWFFISSESNLRRLNIWLKIGIISSKFVKIPCSTGFLSFKALR